MTKQNVVVSDCSSRSGMVTVAASTSALFSPPEALAALGGHIAMSEKKLLKRLEAGGGRVNAWVDSMRDSSPSRIKSTTEKEEQSSWIVRFSLLSKRLLFYISDSHGVNKFVPLFYLFLNCLDNSFVIHQR